MAQTTVLPDRRQIYRPFLERLNPASQGVIDAQSLIVPPEHDPRDPDQPPIHVAFANTAELTRGAQMALVGGIGSGKTTELQLTLKQLERHSDAVNIYVDLAEITDLNELNPGAILIAIGLGIYQKIKKTLKQESPIKVAFEKLRELARGKTDWIEFDDYEPVEDQEPDEEPPLVPVEVPGLLKPKFPAIQRTVFDVRELLLEIARPLLEDQAQITVLIDGLDRLIRPERFREFAEQDLRALRKAKISIIVAAPLLLWFDNSRFLQDYFDDVKHIPAAITDPEKSDFLNQVLRKRGAAELMADREIAEVCRFSGGVMRDLITLARTSAEAAYRDDKDRVEPEHTASAIRQLGKRYLVGLGNAQRQMIRKLIENEEFSVENSLAKQLLVNRQVLEYFSGQRDFFAVHPALAKILTESV
jgi:Cdc6-like AAA superfamily ATPase